MLRKFGHNALSLRTHVCTCKISACKLKFWAAMVSIARTAEVELVIGGHSITNIKKTIASFGNQITLPRFSDQDDDSFIASVQASALTRYDCSCCRKVRHL